MNTRNLPTSVLLLSIGAGAVLLIGAFARFDPASSSRAAIPAPSPPPLTQDDPPTETAAAAALPANLSPGLAEIIKLAQAHVDESVILAYVKNSGQVFSPTADEILYLSDLGLSQDVIGTLVKTAPLASAAPTPQETATAPLPPPATPSVAPSQQQPDATAGLFYNDLATYGTWAQQPDYGLCWQPTVETINQDWCPYVDGGQWIYSDCGWYWQSDYTWGWAAFHYGRWAKVPRQGWVWVPDNIWAPAWVTWRSNPSYIGWAPLPPGVSLNVLAELTYLGKPSGPNPTFGLPPSAYTFVNTGDLTSRHLPRRVLPARQASTLVQHTAVVNNYAIVNNRIFNVGASREAVAAASHKPVPEVGLRAASSPEAAGLAMDRKTLAVYCPPSSSAAAAPAKGLVINNSRDEAAPERSPTQEPMVLAENDSADAAITPVPPNNGAPFVQLPPLRYGAPGNSSALQQHGRNNLVAAAPGSAPIRRDWPRAYAATPVEQPVTSAPAPQVNRYNAGVRQVEPPRPPPVENRPATVEYRPAPEPPRAAPAPMAQAPAASGSRSRN